MRYSKEMTFEEKVAYLGGQIEFYNYHKQWLEDNSWKDGRTSEVRMHKEFMQSNRRNIERVLGEETK